MARDAAAAEATVMLPVAVRGPSDVARLVRELETIEDFIHEAKLRHTETEIKLPRSSLLLEGLATANQYDWLEETDRTEASRFLKGMLDAAPRVHISFATAPSAAFMAKIVAWFRQNIDPLLLIQVGLEPTIAAGCVLRTTDRVFDLSLGKRFDGQRELLIKSLQGTNK